MKKKNPSQYLRENENDYFRITVWMVTRLDLKGVELVLYALIYSFYRTTGKAFFGSVPYMAARINSCERTVQRALQRLESSGLILRTDRNSEEGTSDLFVPTVPDFAAVCEDCDKPDCSECDIFADDLPAFAEKTTNTDKTDAPNVADDTDPLADGGEGEDEGSGCRLCKQYNRCTRGKQAKEESGKAENGRTHRGDDIFLDENATSGVRCKCVAPTVTDCRTGRDSLADDNKEYTKPDIQEYTCTDGAVHTQKMRAFFREYPKLKQDALPNRELDYPELGKRFAESGFLRGTCSFKWILRNYDAILAGYYTDYPGRRSGYEKTGGYAKKDNFSDYDMRHNYSAEYLQSIVDDMQAEEEV